MDFFSPAITAIRMESGELLYVKQIDIGPWNCNTTRNKYVPHGVDWTKVVGCQTIIHRDDGNAHNPIVWGVVDSSSYANFAWSSLTSTSIGIYLGNTLFTTADYSSTAVNRGEVTVFYLG